MRVLVTGMGGELGTRVAQLLEEEPSVSEIVGIDFVPPRRRLRRAEFRRIDPVHRDRLRDFVLEFAPTAVAHFGVYEPASRMGPAIAAQRTELCTVVALSARRAPGGSNGSWFAAGSRCTAAVRARSWFPTNRCRPRPQLPTA